MDIEQLLVIHMDRSVDDQLASYNSNVQLGLQVAFPLGAGAATSATGHSTAFSTSGPNDHKRLLASRR